MAIGAQQIQQLPLLSSGQMGVKGAVGNQALQALQGLGGNQFNFQPLAQQARTQFQTNTIPGLAERFTSLGQGAQRSSAFQGALGQAGGELEQGLAALQSQYGLKQQGLQQQLLGNLLQYALSPEFTYRKTKLGEGGEFDIQSLLSQLLGKSDDQDMEEEEGSQPSFWKRLASFAAQTIPTAVGAAYGGPVGAAAGKAAGSGIDALLNRYF